MSDINTLQNALSAIKKLKQLLQQNRNNTPGPIAIVGVSCRFPQANNKDEFWQLLMQGNSVISAIPEKRWQLLNGSNETSLRDPHYAYFGGYLANIELFDAYFFGISPREAVRMDPQHRILLELAYEAIEDAGLTLDSLAGTNTGVFTSVYPSRLGYLRQSIEKIDALYLPTGNATCMAANRISYQFDLHGPSIVVDTSCSSSLTALHLACLNIQNKLCDTALVGGVNINLLPSIHHLLADANMLSPDGKCNTFDASANGYVPGEGAGVLVLKPFEKALQDKDRIYGVIIGSSSNQDGKTNGLTAPNGLQQEKLLESIYKQTNIDPNEVAYVECHGTGTFLGDPIELEALGAVIGKQRSPENPCWVGSVKTNLGHLEPAAGIASLIKVVLSLKNRQIPPHLNFAAPNPHIAFDKYHFKVPVKPQPWPQYAKYKIAGISGFGFGGTNVHLILRDVIPEEIPSSQLTTETSSSSPKIFTLSAKDPIALQKLIEHWCDYLQKHKSLDVGQICYCTHVKRTHYKHRIAIIIYSLEDLYKACCFARDNGLENLSVSNHYFTHKNSDDPDLKKQYHASKLQSVFDEPSFSLDQETNLTLIAKLYVNDFKIPWSKLEKNYHYSHMDMPLYPWQHKTYWPSFNFVENSKENNPNNHPFYGKQIFSPLNNFQFEFRFDIKKCPEINDTYKILHAGYYTEMLLFSINKIYNRKKISIHQLQFLSPIIVPDNDNLTVQVIFDESENESLFFNFYTYSGENRWVKNATGKLSLNIEPVTPIESISTIKNRCSHFENNNSQLYSRITTMGMPSGDSVRWTSCYWLGKNEILCEFKTPQSAKNNHNYLLNIHPGIIDGCVQPIFILLPTQFNKPYVVSTIDKFTILDTRHVPLYLFLTLKKIESDGKKLIADWYLIDDKSEIMMVCYDVCMTQLSSKIRINEITHITTPLTTTNDPLLNKENIIPYLIEQIAGIFSMPKEDINPQNSLLDMGIDSLMGLVLMRMIETTWKKSYPLQNLLQGSSINDIAKFILMSDPVKETVNTEVIATNNRWIAYRQTLDNIKIRLFCFPHGGSGASVYREWQKMLPDTIEVCPIQLPGRENRMDEIPAQHINDLIPMLADNLHHEFDLPFAFFGHSFGSLLAFELSRYLRKNKLREPIHLFASAFPNPRTPARSLNNLMQQLKENHFDLFKLNLDLLNDDQLETLSIIFGENGVASYNSQVMDKQILKTLLPIFVTDMNLVKNYQYNDEIPLNLPITLFTGKKDAWVTLEDRKGWEKHTQKQFTLYEFDSGHLFIRDDHCRKEILQKIITELNA